MDRSNVFNNWKLSEIIALTYNKPLTYAAMVKAVERYESYSEFAEYSAHSNRGNELFAPTVDSLGLARDQIEKAGQMGVDIVTYWDETYPPYLRQISAAPVCLYVKGKIEPEDTFIAIVGTRKCSMYGKLVTEKFSQDLVSAGITIVSGMAYGVDTISHTTAIKQKGRTIAVIASGLDCVAPQYAEQMLASIAESGGAVVSEYKMGVKALPAYFPQRNRIISGISKATIVIESDIKGGSLITAGFALDQGREVFAVPGNVTSSKSAGCNKLIHDSMATPAMSIESVLKDLGLLDDKALFDKKKESIKFDSNEDRQIYELLSGEPVQVDYILEKTNIEISQILVILLNFEFKGLARKLPGNYYIRANY